MNRRGERADKSNEEMKEEKSGERYAIPFPPSLIHFLLISTSDLKKRTKTIKPKKERRNRKTEEGGEVRRRRRNEGGVPTIVTVVSGLTVLHVAHTTTHVGDRENHAT